MYINIFDSTESISCFTQHCMKKMWEKSYRVTTCNMYTQSLVGSDLKTPTKTKTPSANT